MPKKNTMDDLRDHCFEALERLRDAESAEEIDQELKRARGVAEITNQLVSTAKVEIDALRAVELSPELRPSRLLAGVADK